MINEKLAVREGDEEFLNIFELVLTYTQPL